MRTPDHTRTSPGPLAADGAVALDYARRMFHRQSDPLPPPGFRVDWDDQPFRHTFYRDAPKLPLPAPFSLPVSGGVLASVERARTAGASAQPTLQELSSALACYAVTGRRTSPDWNEDSTRKLHTGQATWSRPTASGGGMYPVETYLVAGAGAVLPCGVYHYDTAHHALDRLTARDRTAELAAACGTRAPLYLVATLRFWKNSFKYNSFSYHVVTQDTGALLGAWRMVLGAFGHAPRPVLWFDEAPVGAAVGVDGRTEAPFAMVPLGEGADGAAPRPPSVPSRAPRPRVWERSRRVRSFEMVDQVHLAALVGDTPRPAPDAGDGCAPVPLPGGGSGVPLPPVADPAEPGGLERALRTRRSAFGVMASRPALDTAALGRVLAAAERIGRCPTDVAPAADRRPWLRLRLLAHTVEGLEQRAYCYDGDSHRLLPGPAVDFSDLQRHYALTNYDLRQCAAVAVVCARLEPLVAAYGARGYRMLGIEVGQAAQSAYLAAAEADLAVGAVLGLDNPAIDDLLGLSDTDERSMLFLLLGRPRTPRTGYDHSLHRTLPSQEEAQP